MKSDESRGAGTDDPGARTTASSPTTAGQASERALADADFVPYLSE